MFASWIGRTCASLCPRVFEVPSKQPLRGGVPIADFIQELEGHTEVGPHLAQARRDLAGFVDKPGTLRHLRLAAGMSQAELAELAETTQSYIARIEAGTLDPGTDMLVRLAAALGIE
jgi:DNA-binding XRE family transcriptional regulator